MRQIAPAQNAVIPPATVIAYANGDSAGSDRNVTQYPVIRYADIATATVFFGTRFVNGTCQSVSQSITQFLNSKLRVRAFYDSKRRPVFLLDELSLKAILITYTDDTAQIHVFNRDHELLDTLKLDKANGAWRVARLEPTIYEARGSVVDLAASKPGTYDFQTLIIKTLTSLTWNASNRSLGTGVAVEWPSEQDQKSRAETSSVGVPTWMFLKTILEPPSGRKSAPMLDELVIGKSLFEARTPLINCIRAANGLTREEIERLSQGSAAYAAMDQTSAAYMKNNQGASVEEAFSEPLWTVMNASEVGDYSVVSGAIYAQFACIVEPDGLANEQLLGIPSTLPNAYDSGTDTIKDKLQVATKSVDIVAKPRPFDALNSVVSPTLNRAGRGYLVFDLNKYLDPITLSTNSASGSANFVQEGAGDGLSIFPFYFFFKYSDWRLNPTQGLGTKPPSRILVWRRTTNSGTTVTAAIRR